MSVNGEERTFYGAVLAFLADILAAHCLGSFKESVSFALRVCRSCTTTTQQMQNVFVESSCTWRTPESYLQQCTLLTGPLRDHYSTTFGINRLSLLEETPGFSVANGLPRDIMHDLFEDVVPYELKLFIRYLTTELRHMSLVTTDQIWLIPEWLTIPISRLGNQCLRW